MGFEILSEVDDGNFVNLKCRHDMGSILKICSTRESTVINSTGVC